MTDNELKRLNRTELLEMLIAQSKETEQLKQELAEAQQKLDDREIRLSKAGSIAEAALLLNGVFEAAQAASEQYLINVRKTEDLNSNMLRQAQEESTAMVENARQEAAALLDNARREAEAVLADAQEQASAQQAAAKAQADRYWAEVSQKLERFYQQHQGCGNC